MKTTKYTQFATLLVLFLTPLLAIFIVKTILFNNSPTASIITFATLSVITTLVLLNFYKLDIIIDQTHLTFKMGIGLIRGKYPLASISGCKAVRNSFYNGLGVRIISNGMLYNVWGLKAVELTFTNKSSVVRIGTNQPDAVVADLSERISIDQTNILESTNRKNNSLKYKILLFGSIGVIIISFSFYSSLDAKVTLNTTTLEISGIYGCELPYAQISKIDTVTHLPNIEYKSNGYGLFSVHKGYFVLTNVGEAVLYINSNSTPIIQMQLKNGQYYFLNQSEKLKTIEIFETLKSKIKP